ncbi:MAG: sulfotransferase [Methylomicrobium sp.]|nr:sulfotransferase [Methylomicrobium sp.]
MKNSHQLLLLFGMPRSGTTWLAKMIDSAPDVIYRHEPDSENKIAMPTITYKNERYDQIIKEYCESLINCNTVKICGKMPFFKKSYYNPVTYLLFKNSVYLSKIAKRFHCSTKIIELIDRDRKNLFLLWKSIESIGRSEAIMKAMPQCKMIYIIRNPCGHIASVLSGEKYNEFSSAVQAWEDYGIFEKLLKTEAAKKRGLTLDSIKSYNAIERLAYRWLLYNEHALTSLNDFASRTFIVRYEDICERPIEKLKEIFEFSGLNWNEQTEIFIKKSISLDSGGYYSVYKNPVISSEKWKKQLSDKDVETIYKTILNSKCGDLYKN